ncbi:MAG: hypothetical protein IJS01_01880 [Lentisphaeria bacterium]|nr:hypothetical protein [Lentisphaeria bacterium]
MTTKAGIITRIMEHPALLERPPVLVDVGASGKVHEAWKAIAPYSICLAFDGDDRDLKLMKSGDSGYKELLLYHRILTADRREEATFYLTRFPHCSSLLEPDLASLSNYSFRDSFEVEKKISLKAVNLPEVLAENHLDRVDWFKTDSQGTDLRLFQSLPEAILPGVKIAEFEPGIIDAYRGEDKFADLLRWMEGKPFFLDRLDVMPVCRIEREALEKFRRPDLVQKYMKKTPGWVNALYMNTGEEIGRWSLRDGMFFLVCCLLNGQDGMCVKCASALEQRFPDEPLLPEIRRFSESLLDVGVLSDICRRFRNRLRRLIGALSRG